MRLDLQDSNGMTPTRPSASTHAAMTTSSSSGKMVTTGTSTMGEHTFGDEVEVHTLLVIDQHTFEGKYEWFLFVFTLPVCEVLSPVICILLLEQFCIIVLITFQHFSHK